MTTAPHEPRGGQETEPPDVRLFAIAVRNLLQHLVLQRVGEPLSPDDRLRVAALAAVAQRLQEHLEAQP